MNYFVKFDQREVRFGPNYRIQPLIRGEGPTLYTAIDDLESRLNQSSVPSEKLNLGVLIREKKDEIELTAKNLNLSLGRKLSRIREYVMTIVLCLEDNCKKRAYWKKITCFFESSSKNKDKLSSTVTIAPGQRTLPVIACIESGPRFASISMMERFGTKALERCW